MALARQVAADGDGLPDGIVEGGEVHESRPGPIADLGWRPMAAVSRELQLR